MRLTFRKGSFTKPVFDVKLLLKANISKKKPNIPLTQLQKTGSGIFFVGNFKIFQLHIQKRCGFLYFFNT